MIDGQIEKIMTSSLVLWEAYVCCKTSVIYQILKGQKELKLWFFHNDLAL